MREGMEANNSRFPAHLARFERSSLNSQIELTSERVLPPKAGKLIALFQNGSQIVKELHRGSRQTLSAPGGRHARWRGLDKPKPRQQNGAVGRIMEGAFPIVIFGLIAVLVVVVIVCSAIAARKRREALSAMAARLGLNYRPDKDPEIARQFAFLNRLAQGSNRYAFNILSGTYQGHFISAFDYHYETHSTDSKGRQQTSHNYFSFFVLLLPHDFPELRVVTEGLMSKIAQAFGYDDIDFESAEFSSAFCVRSKDKRFAYDVCNPQMIEYLLENRDFSMEIERNALAISFAKCLSADKIEGNLTRLVHLRSLMPDYLFT
jgi:hypothetical protein